MSVVDTPPADGSALSDVDRLFATLDGAKISDGRSEWSPQILGIHADGPYVWVQLSRDGQDGESVVLRLPRATTAADVIRALGAVRFGTGSPTVVRV